MQKSLSKMSLKANEERIFKMESRVQFAAMKSMHLENVIFADQQRYPKLIHELSAADKKMLKWHNTAPDNDISYSFLRYHQIGNYLFPVFAIRNNSDKVISYLDGRMLVINPQGKQIDNKFLIINDRAPLLQAKQEGVLIYPHQLYSRHYPSTIKLHIIKTEVFGKRLELAK